MTSGRFSIVIGAVAAFSVLPVSTMQQAPQQFRRGTAVAFTETEPGLAIADATITVGSGSIPFHMVQASLRRFRLAVALPPANEQGDTLANFVTERNAVAALSGGFLKSFFPPIPLGLLKSRGKMVNRSTGGDLLNGVLAIRGPVVNILQAANFVDQSWDDCLQSGPLLISDRQPVLPTRLNTLIPSTRTLISNAYVRAFIALSAPDQVVFGLTGPITLSQLADVLRRDRASGGLEVLAALNLGGADSAGLVVSDRQSTKSFGNTYPELSDALVLVRADTSNSVTQRRRSPR